MMMNNLFELIFITLNTAIGVSIFFILITYKRMGESHDYVSAFSAYLLAVGTLWSIITWVESPPPFSLFLINCGILIALSRARGGVKSATLSVLKSLPPEDCPFFSGKKTPVKRQLR